MSLQEVSFRPPACRAIAMPGGLAYTPPDVTADALLAELEQSPAAGTPWSRTPPLPPARAAAPHLPGPRRLNYTHEDCIDAILANPAITQNELAARYGYTPSWVSLIVSSDAFQAALAKRRDEILSPEFKATIEERFKALVERSQGVLLEALHTKPTPGLALGILGTASKALGYGARDMSVHVNASFVVALPPASANSEEWAKGRVIEHAQQPVGLPSVQSPTPATVRSSGAQLTSPTAPISPTEKT